MFSFRKKTQKSEYQPGITPRSLVATILCMLLASIYTNYSVTYLAEHYQIVEAAIPIPALIAVLGLTLLVGLFGVLFKMRLLSKAELVCVAFATMISAPMMSEGFWQRFFGIIAATPRAASFDYIDVYNDSLWPHGENLFKGSFEAFASGGEAKEGVHVPSCGSFTNISWSTVEYEEGLSAVCPKITNTSATDETYLSFMLPVVHTDDAEIIPSHPHLLSVLGYLENPESETEVFCRAFADENEVPESLLISSARPKKTLLHKKGFVRMGSYGVIPARVCVSNLLVQVGLRGRGSVTFADPKFFSVYTVESCFRGRRMIDEADWLALAPEDRPAGAVVRPSNPWSLKGLKFYIAGHIPLKDWWRPSLIWSAFILLLLGALFCVNVIMRRKWAESERYPMPNTRIPLAFVGADDSSDSPWAGMWRNRYVWFGLAFAFAFGMIKGWHCYNPRVPNLEVVVNLGDYITNPVFGNMFNARFVFLLTVCSIAIFFELNVLMSIVLGYWICRSVYCLGHVAGIDINGGFPWRDEQAVGAYLGYAIVVLLLSAKYLWGVLKEALKGTARQPGEVLSSRAAVVVLLLTHIGMVGWAQICGASAVSILIFFSFLVTIGFVTAKFRAECGSPYGYFTPYNCMFFVAVVGGISVFGTKGMFVSLLLSGCVTVTTFYLIPGMQFEMIEVGKRMKIQPRHIIYTCLLGVLGGLFLGGWGFLTHGYADGADNIRGAWLYNSYGWFVNQFRAPLAMATNDWLREDSGVKVVVANWGRRAMITSGSIMVVLTVLRQFFSGFWFHPVGFMLGWTNIDNGAPWGTLLVAWAIRFTVLKIGGAKAVREKLLPFFTGAFAGCILSIITFTVINSFAFASGSPNFAYVLP